jgi:hypothetical protein
LAICAALEQPEQEYTSGFSLFLLVTIERIFFEINHQQTEKIMHSPGSMYLNSKALSPDALLYVEGPHKQYYWQI